jgi:exopolysaccharide biosynthesis polyprenyl glycosylphosphotransferase
MAGEGGGSLPPLRRRIRRDRVVLAVVDGVLMFAAFAVVFAAFGRFDAMGVVLNSLGAAAIGLLAMHVEGLWLERIIAVRWLELAKLTRLAAVLLVGALILDRVPGSPITLLSAAVAGAVSWLLLVVWRSVYRSWLRVRRQRGHDFQRVLVVGSDQRVLDVVRTFAIHPEAGMHVVGLVGSQAAARAAGLDEVWLGELSDLSAVLAGTPTDCAIVGPTHEVGTESLDLLLQTETDVYSVPARGGIDARRISATAFANELLIHVDPVGLSPLAWGIKRTFDVLVSSLLLVLTSPLFAVIAVAIKATDRGPVLFKQRRVGRDEQEFEVLKFRTMVVDAEARLAELQAANARSGPLFKMAVDPRVTRVGRFLRATSLDELPQLINVVRGDMSLVGPRPALRREVEQFPDTLRQRHGVRPGITGLWQVEARDNPSFDAYERLDVFYVKNWSLALDIVIMLGTVEQLVMRPFVGRKEGEMSAVGPASAQGAEGDQSASISA